MTALCQRPKEFRALDGIDDCCDSRLSKLRYVLLDEGIDRHLQTNWKSKYSSGHPRLIELEEHESLVPQLAMMH